MASTSHPPVAFSGNLASKTLASDLLRSSRNGVCGVPLKALGRARLSSKKRDFAVSAKVRKVKKHEYPWPEDPDLNVKGGVLSHLSPFKPLKEKQKPVTLDFEKPLMDLQKKIIDVQKMANETGLDFSDQIISLENKYQQCVEVEVHSDQVSSNELTDGQSIMPKGVLDLQELRTRIKSVEKVVEDMNKPILHQPLHIKAVRDNTASEIEVLKSQHTPDREKHELAGRRDNQNEHGDDRNQRKAKPKSFEVKNGTLMKDIPLDHVSDSSPERIRRATSAADRVDDQMLELWETAEGSSLSHSMKDFKKRANHPTEGPTSNNQFRNLDWRGKHPPTESEVEKELGVDKLELSMNSSEANQEMNKKILQRLASDAEKLMSLQMTVDNLRRKLESNRKARKPKNVDFETVKEQLQEVEEMVVQLVNLNSQLMKITEESSSYSTGSASADSKEVMNIRQKRVSEQARKGSEKIGRLQLEIQKIQYILLKLDDEKKSKASYTGIILKNFIHIGRRNSEKKKKAHLCCFRPSGSSSSSNSNIRYHV